MIAPHWFESSLTGIDRVTTPPGIPDWQAKENDSMRTIRGTTNRKTTIAENGGVFLATFWINDEQVSYRQESRTYKTLPGALRAGRKWAAGNQKCKDSQ